MSGLKTDDPSASLRTGRGRKRYSSEAGQSLLWMTFVMMFVLVPLLVLVVDGIQFWRIRNQLQTATDAACEEAAYVGADRRAYRDSGVTRFGDIGQAKADATKTFYTTLHNAGALQYDPAIQIRFDNGVPSAICNSVASVQPLISALAPSISIQTESESEIRFSR